MLSSEILSEAFVDFERQKLDDIAEARKLKLPAPLRAGFLTSKLSEVEVKRVIEALPKLKHKDIKTKSVGFLYVFSQRQGCSVKRADILGAIQRAKRGGEDNEIAIKNLCAINSEASDGRVLYVGRSWDPRGRVAGHLNASTSKTYAIHFAAWAQNLDLQVDLSVYAFPGIQDRVLQILEDVIWDTLVPLLGRRGEK